MADTVKVGNDHPQITNSDNRTKIGLFLTNFTKFALDSAVNASFKGFTGGKKAYEIIQERLKYRQCPLLLDDKKKCIYVESAEEMQAKIEEMHELMTNAKPQSETSVKLAERSLPQKKIPKEGIEVSDLQKTKDRRILIRSRL